MHKPTLLALVMATTLAVAGCGASDELSAGEFKTEVNDLCKSVNTDLKKKTRGLNGRVANDAKKIGAIIEPIEQANADFGELEPPEELKDEAEAFAESNEKQLEIDREAVEAAKEGDQKAYDAALAELQKLDAEGDKRAKAIGATACVDS